MRKIEFEVPAEVIGDFTEKLAETGLDNRVLGKNEEDEIAIEVYYEKSDMAIVDELEDHLNDLKRELYEEEEEEDEDQSED
jgi:hypothetical protein